MIKQHFPDIDSQKMAQYEALKDLYEHWNAQINVVSRKDIDYLYTRHVLHSLSIARVVQFKPGADVMDIGTGGGFPGIPLAIMFPEVRFVLVDSIAKKIKVVQAVIDALNLKNTVAHHKRAEQVEGKFDFVTSRGVTRLATMIHWVEQKIKPKHKNSLPNGLLCLKGGDLQEELAEVSRPTSLYSIQQFFDDPFFQEKQLVHVAISKKDVP